jgi:hypothetical protein
MSTGMMGGLMGPGSYPQCPNDATHGPMERQPGTYSLDQVLLTQIGWNRTGTFYATTVFRCKTCGLIQLYDQDK